MANTFGILAALVLLFAAFVANKNKEAIEQTIAVIGDEENKKERQTNAFNTLVDEIAVEVEEKEAADVARQDKQVELDKQDAANKATQADLDSKKAEAASMEEEVASAQDKLKEIGELRELGPKIEALKMTVDGLEDDVALINAQVSKLRSDQKSTSDRSQDLKEQNRRRTVGQSQPWLKTRISSIFRNYGFVTLAAGDANGVVGGSKLSVLRNGEEIAQLKVTAVEANSASANIIPSSIKEETSISVGDVVVPVESDKE